jgi:hypothetical protein
MLEAEARQQLEIMVAYDSDPILSATEVDLLLSHSSTDDETVWNLNIGAAMGWRWKAGKVANRYNMSTDVTSLSRSQLFTQCREMEKSYRKGVIGTIEIRRLSVLEALVIGNLNGAP